MPRTLFPLAMIVAVSLSAHASADEIRFAAPPAPEALTHWKGALLVALFIALAFPMAGISLVVVLGIDAILISRIPMLKRALS